MIRVYTNHPEFLNDIAEVIRLYLPAGEVVPGGDEAPGDTLVRACLYAGEGWEARAECLHEGQRAEYAYAHPKVEGGELIIKRYRKRCLKIAVFRALGRLVEASLPWGSLTGIRPTRLLRELIEEKGEAEALRFMGEEFDVSPAKLALAREIVEAQRPAMDFSERDVDVYIGIPFCRTRCLYCSFASEVRRESTDMEAYLGALCRDISLGAQIAKEAGYTLRSMYMGGGTPTILTAPELERVLSHALAAYGGFGRELTVEAGRPDTITAEKLSIIRAMGGERVSINPQTMNGDTLRRMGRSHGPEEIAAACRMAREAGFTSINMDIIAGLPGETLKDVEHTLERIAELRPENLTVHTLAIKRSSLLKQRLAELPPADAATAGRMVEAGERAARAMGMGPYYMYRQKYMSGNLENVGYALPGKECIYNIDMMEETVSIMAHGAGSMTKRVFDGEKRVERIPNPKDIATYIAKVEEVARAKAGLYGVS